MKIIGEVCQINLQSQAKEDYGKVLWLFSIFYHSFGKCVLGDWLGTSL